MSAEQAAMNNDDPFEPIDLDPPAPAMIRWMELAEENDIIVHHGGDVTKVSARARPAWSDPESDETGPSPSHFVYVSDPVRVPVLNHNGLDDGEVFEPARISARVVMTASHDGTVYATRITMSRVLRAADPKRPWTNTTMALSRDETLAFANALIAAADLIGGAE